MPPPSCSCPLQCLGRSGNKKKKKKNGTAQRSYVCTNEFMLKLGPKRHMQHHQSHLDPTWGNILCDECSQNHSFVSCN